MELTQTWNKYSYEYNRPLYGSWGPIRWNLIEWGPTYI
jgi:hypothetical protein